MSFTDPVVVTINAVPFTMPRTSVVGDETVYTDPTGLVSVLASHESGKRTRRMLRINHSKLTTDPFKPAENVKVSMSFYLVFDIPPAGYTPTEAQQVYTGFNTWYTASTSAVIGKLLAGES